MFKNPDVLFWDVDTQHDFMDADGALAVPGAEEIKPNLARLTEAAREHGVPVIASADDHETSDPEISDDPDLSETYPPHCMRGTEGQEKIAETRIPETVTIGHERLADAELEGRIDEATRALLVLKKRFDVFTNPNAERLVRRIAPKGIVVYGVALDVCNKAAIDGLWQRGFTRLTLVTDATRPLDEAEGERLLAEWRDRGVELITTDEAVARVTEPVAMA